MYDARHTVWAAILGLTLATACGGSSDTTTPAGPSGGATATRFDGRLASVDVANQTLVLTDGTLARLSGASFEDLDADGKHLGSIDEIARALGTGATVIIVCDGEERDDTQRVIVA